MPTKAKYTAALLSDAYYHSYNRSNNKEVLFKSDENRRYFLKKYATYLYSCLKTYANCLMDNHFHLLVQVRSAEGTGACDSIKSPERT